MADTRTLPPVQLQPGTEEALSELYSVPPVDLEQLSQMMPSAGIPAARGISPAGAKGAPSANVRRYEGLIRDAAARYGVDPSLMMSMIHAESAGNPAAVSHAGARGLAQFMPDTAKRFGVQDPHDPAQAIEGMGKYLNFLGKKFNNNQALMAAAYNAGEGNVDKYGGVPPFAETRNYLNRIQGLYGGYGGAAMQDAQAPQQPQFETVHLDNGQTVQVEPGSSLEKLAEALKANNIQASPMKPFQTPRGVVQVPYNMADNDIINMIQKSKPELLTLPGHGTPTTGIIPALVGGAERGVGLASRGVGETLQRLGAEDWAGKAKEFGMGLEQKAAETTRPMTEEEMAAQGLWGKVKGKMLQPAAEMLGQVGAPLAAGAVTGMPLVGVAGLTAQGVGNVTEAAEAAGKPLSNTELALHAGVDTALNFFRLPAIGPLRGLITESLSPAVREGVARAVQAGDKEAAIQLLSGPVSQIAKGIGTNYATNALANVGAEANIRSALGQELTSPEALEQYKQGEEAARWLSVPFGVHHGLAARKGQLGQVENIAAEQEILKRQYERQEQERLQQEQGGVEPPAEQEDFGEIPEPPLRAKAAPTEEPAPAPEPPAAEEPAPEKPYYDQLGLSPKNNVYKTLAQLDINNPEHHDTIVQALDAALENPRLKVKNADAIQALRDQLRPPEQEQPIPETIEPKKRKAEAAKAPEPAPAPEPTAPRTPEEIQQEIALHTQRHNEALKQGDMATVAEAANRVKDLRAELAQIQPEVTPSAKQKPEAGAPDGGGRPQPSVREKGRDKTVSGKGVEPSGQGEQVAEKVPEVKAKEEVVPPTEKPAKVKIKRKTAKGSTPEETKAAIQATETAKQAEEVAKKQPEPKAEVPVEAAPARDFDKEVEDLRKQVEDAKVAHKALKEELQPKLWKIMDSKPQEAAKLEQRLADSRANGIAMKQKLAELEHEKAMHEAELEAQKTAALAKALEKKVPEKTLREEPELTEEEKLAKLQAKIDALNERSKKNREEAAKAGLIQSVADQIARREDEARRKRELKEAKGKPVEGVTSVKETEAAPTPESIKAKIDAVTHPAENLKRRRAKAAKKKEEPKLEYTKPVATEVPNKRPNLPGIFGTTAAHPEWAKRYAESREASHVIYSDGNTAIRTTVGRNLFGQVTHGLQVMHLDADGRTIHIGKLGDSVHDQIKNHRALSKVFSREQVSDLVKAELAHADEEMHQFNLKPEGPVTNAKGNVAHSESVAPELADIVRDWMKMLGMKDDKIFITTMEDMRAPDARARYGLFAGPSGRWDHLHAIPFGPRTQGKCSTVGDGRYAITLRDASNITPETLEILAHEMGHAFEKKEFANAPKEIQDAIKAEYEKWRSKYTTGPAGSMKAKPGIATRELIKDLRAYHSAQASAEKWDEADLVENMSPRDLEYFAGFPEWFADQTAKWATTSAKPLTAVDKFFKSIADGLRKIYASLTGKEDKYLPNPVFKRFLDSRETPTLADIAGILKPSEPTKISDEEMRGGHSAEDYFAQRKLTQRPPTTAEAAKKNLETAIDVSNKILTHPTYMGGLFSNLRSSIVDEFAGLSRALKHLPTFDPNGKARADMLASQQRMERQFIGEALQTGFVRKSPSGFFYIESSDQNIHNLMQKAAKLKGLKDPIRAVGDVLRALVGEHWTKETEDLRHKAAARFAASRRWAQYAKTLTDYEERKKADKMASVLRKEAAKIKARVGEGPGEGLEKLVTQEDIAQAKRMLQDIPGLQDIVDGVHENMRSLVDLHEETGMINAATAKKWKANPYIPLYKSMQELEDYLDTSRAGRIFGGAKSLPKVHEIMGGTHAVDVFQNLQKHTAMMTMAAFKNNVRRTAIDQLALFGGSRRLAPGTHIGNPQAVLVRENGQDVFHEVQDPYIFNALQMAQPATNEIMHWLAQPSKVLRAGALMNPGYWYRQLVRDPILVNFVSQTGAITPLHTVAEFAKIVSGMVTGKAPKEYDVLRRHGLTGVVDPSFTDPIKFSEAIGKGMGAPKKAVNFWLGVHEAADSATRVAVYKQAMKDAKKRGYTGQEAEDFAVMRAREVINFSNRGSSNAVNFWRQSVPFFGAALNGLDVVARSATGTNLSPKEAKIARQLFWSRAMAISTMSMAMAMYWGNKQQYQDLSEEDKASNWIMGFDKDGAAYKFPIPPDVGFLFKVLPEAMVQNIMGVPSHKDRDKVLKQVFMDTVMPPGLFPPIPQALRPIIEHITNMDLHGGFPIESEGDKNMPVEQRGRGKATTFARWVSDNGGADMNFSPAKVDHFFKATLGDAYGTLGMLADMYLKSDEEMFNKNDVEKYPWLKAFKTNPKNLGDKGELYDMVGEADGMVSTIRRIFRSGDVEQMRRYTSPADMAKFAASKPLGKIMTTISAIDNQIRVLENKKTHTETDKTTYDTLLARKMSLMKAATNLGRQIKATGESAEEIMGDEEDSTDTED